MLTQAVPVEADEPGAQAWPEATERTALMAARPAAASLTSASPATASPAVASPATASPAAARPRPVRSTAGSPGPERETARASSVTSRLRRQGLWVAALSLILIAAVGTAVALVRQSPAASSTRQASAGATGGPAGAGSHATSAKAIAGLSKSAIIRSRAARWIVREVSRSVIIACDDVMCSQLFNQGIPASNLLVLSPSAPDPLGADIVIGTPALRSQFGSRLALVYAPSAIASFGAGRLRVDVRVVAPQGAAAYELALNRDVAARQRDGSQLLRNSGITVSASAQPELIAGLVDPRLLVTLPVLATQHPIRIVAFYDRAPGSGRGIPLSGVELAAADGASGLTGGAYRHWLLGFFRGQRAPFRAVSVTTVRVHGRALVLVRFARPSPIGMLIVQ